MNLLIEKKVSKRNSIPEIGMKTKYKEMRIKYISSLKKNNPKIAPVTAKLIKNINENFPAERVSSLADSKNSGPLRLPLFLDITNYYKGRKL